MPDESVESVAAEEWERADARCVSIAKDESLVGQCHTLRALVMREAFARHRKELELACGRFGHFLGSHGATPTLAARSAESLGAVWTDACGTADDLRAARTAIFEGYVFARTAEEREAASRGWEPSDIVVFVDANTATVAASPPFEDGEQLSAWSDRVAAYLACAGTRCALAAGHEAALLALESSCKIAGVAFARAVRRPT